MQSASVSISWWLDEENIVHAHTDYSAIKMNEITSFSGNWMELDRVHYVKWNKPDWKRQIPHILPHMQNLVFKDEEQECQVGRVLGWLQWWGEAKGEGERLKSFPCVKIEPEACQSRFMSACTTLCSSAHPADCDVHSSITRDKVPDDYIAPEPNATTVLPDLFSL
jgi:hypothetical protein